MHITLGLSLDGRQGPSLKNTLNEPVVGRMGLLGLLEMYLGLSRPEVSQARRVTSYLGHLRRHADRPRFYSRSLEADSVGTSARLLAWRDEWRLAGWDGSTPADGPRRLQEMALVEQSAFGDIPPGEAERLTEVLTSLATERTPIQTVLLVDPLESFPAVWRRVLALLPNVTQWQPEPQGAGQLRQLQERAVQALQDGQLEALASPIADGSVVLVQASTRETAEHWLSATCRESGADRLLVCESEGDSLDATMRATGCAASGFQNSSELRPALQAVGLALEMCWKPVDIGRLVEFLSHPIGPFSRSVRASLARAVADQPGIGGEAWEKVKADLKASDGGEPILDDIAFWLEGERWTRDMGAPVDALLTRVDRLAEALRKRLTGDEALRAAVTPAVGQCAAIREGLVEFQGQGVANLTPRQLEQLVVQATPTGATNPGAPAQVGCIRAESSAAACIEPASEVIWWMPSTPQLPQPLPWSQTELEALRKLGVELRSPQQELDSLAQQWLQPLLAAKERFVLVLPPAGAEEHPFRQLLLRLAPSLQGSCINLDTELSNEFVGTLSANLASMQLPQAPRYIELGEPVALPVERQSFTSLSELFNAPALYAVKRVARLRPTQLLAVEEDNRLLGTLAHRVFEKLFEQVGSLTWTDQQAMEWFRGHIDELLATEGALLLMHGAGVSQQRFKSVCEGAILSMLSHLRAAGATGVCTEFALEGKLGGVHLVGKADLLVQLPKGQSVVLDMKWRGDKRYAASLHEGQHLQLALYSSLCEQQTGTAPAALGYFILESGAMFVTAPDVMPEAQVRTPPVGSTADLLQQAMTSWKWRAEQWSNGQIEVVSIGGGEDFQGPPGTLQVEGPKTWDKDLLVLLGGWEQ